MIDTSDFNDLAPCLWPLWYRLVPEKRESVYEESSEGKAKEEDTDVAFLAPSPTVRQAIMLYELLPHYDHPAYAARIEHVVQDWLGGTGIIEFFDSEDVHLEDRASVYLDMILKSEAAAEPEDETDDDEKVRGSVWERKTPFSLMVAEYRAWYGVSPLDEPWPFFLNQVRHLHKVKAEFALANMTWYLSARSTNDEGINALYKQAGYRKGGKLKMDDNMKRMIEESKRRVEAQKESSKELVRLMKSQQGMV